MNIVQENSLGEDNRRWLLFNGTNILTLTDGPSFPFPTSSQIAEYNLRPENPIDLGEHNGFQIFGANITSFDSTEFFQLTDFRKLYGLIDINDIWFVGISFQLVQFEQEHQICGRCGTPNENKSDEKAKICPECGLVVYSKISPAVIMAVTKGDEILLAHSSRFQEKLFSVLAGFVEPGETLEECVKREVMEEVGITVKNIKYFASQPWPFSSSLMIAYTAEYETGEIVIDPNEITEAGWYKYDDLPLIPSTISIARKLIDWFVENRKQDKNQ